MAIDKTSDTFLIDSYEGQGGYCTGSYLVKHPRETDEKLKARIDLAVYPNFARKIVDVFMGFLWQQSPTREVDDLYTQFLANADSNKGKLDTLMFSYQRLAMILGTVYIIVDRPKDIGTSKASQSLPYLALRKPSQLVAEVKNSAGVWESITFSEIQNKKTVYRTYTLTGWLLSKNADGSDILDQGVYNLGKVPVVALHIAKPLEPTDSKSISFFYDLAALNWDLYNLTSELRELLRSQTFSILTIPVKDENERAKLTGLTISTENALTYNPEGGGVPGFVAPPADPVQCYETRIDKVIDCLYKIASLEFIGSVQPSGEALKYHFMQTNRTLAGMAEMADLAENQIADLVYLWQGKEFGGAISYCNDFNLSDIAAAVATAIDTITLGMGPEFDNTLKKRLAKQILANDTSPAVMAAIDKEIDAGGDLYNDRVQKDAGVNKEVVL